jgi:two-component system nitrate/nitrite response regulator NarL
LIRIAIISANPESARGLAEFLSEDDLLEVVALHGAPESATLDDHVDLLLLVDAHRLSTNGPPAVVVSSRPAQPDQFGGRVRAWLPRGSSADEIRAAVLAAANDLVVLTRPQARLWLRGETGEPEPIATEALTPRERQVLRMLADGLGNKQIAAKLGISEHTAKFHVAQILAKLGAETRTEAVALGIRGGMLPL